MLVLALIILAGIGIFGLEYLEYLDKKETRRE
jgi:hypothetical protein